MALELEELALGLCCDNAIAAGSGGNIVGV